MSNFSLKTDFSALNYKPKPQKQQKFFPIHKWNHVEEYGSPYLASARDREFFSVSHQLGIGCWASICHLCLSEAALRFTCFYHFWCNQSIASSVSLCYHPFLLCYLPLQSSFVSKTVELCFLDFVNHIMDFDFHPNTSILKSISSCNSSYGVKTSHLQHL